MSAAAPHTETTDPQPTRRTGARAALVLGCAGPFVGLLDVTIVNLAIPQLARDLPSAGVADLTWVITAYAVVFAALLAPFGRMADAVGRRTLYAVGLALFTLASAACAVAPGLPLLLAARVAQGIGAAALVPTSLAIVLAQVKPRRRMAAVGAWAASASLAGALGPGLGGLLVDTLGWRSVFLINVPLGIALVPFLRSVASGRSGARRLPDLLGAGLLAVGVGGIVLGITRAHDWGWTSPATLLTITSGLLAVLGALRRSRDHPAPGIEVGLWRTPGYAVANLVSVFFGITLYPWLLVGILFLTDIWGYTTLAAGLAVTHSAVVSGAAGVWASTRGMSPRTAMMSGAALLAMTAAALAALLGPPPTLWQLWIPTGITCGLGIGLLGMGVSAAAALSVSSERFASATGLNLAARQLGGAIGVAVLAAVLGAAGGPDVSAYRTGYAVCGAAAVLAGVAAAAYGRRPTRAVGERLDAGP